MLVYQESTDAYGISLNKKELQFLYDVMMSIGGNPNKSRRKYSTSFLNAVREYCGKDFTESTQDIRGSLTFEDRFNICDCCNGEGWIHDDDKA